MGKGLPENLMKDDFSDRSYIRKTERKPYPVFLRNPLKLIIIQIRTESVLSKQIFMISTFNNIAVFHSQNNIGIFDGLTSIFTFLIVFL